MNGNDMSRVSFVLGVSLLIIIGVVAFWDIYVNTQGRPDQTVSAIVTSWSTRFPMLTLTVGLVIGHIFWK